MSKSNGLYDIPYDAPRVTPRRAEKQSSSLYMNLFPVNIQMENIYCYRWSITPEVDNNIVSENILGIAFDTLNVQEFIIRKHSLYTKRKIQNFNQKIAYKSEAYAVQIEFEQEKNLQKDETLQNELIGEIYHQLEFDQIGRNFYYSNTTSKPKISANEEFNQEFAPISLANNRLILRKGLTSAIHAQAPTSAKKEKMTSTQGYLELDFTSKIFQNKTILVQIEEWLQKNFSSKQIEQILEGHTFITSYNGLLNQITGVAWDKSPKSTFSWTNLNGENQEISFEDYYYQKYQVKVTNFEQPLLIRQSKRGASYFIPEFCQIVGLLEEDENDFKIRQDITQLTQKSPNDRLHGIQKFVHHSGLQQKLKQWGFKISTRMLECKGNHFLPRKIQTKSGDLTFKAQNPNWQSALNRAQVWEAHEIKNWLIIYPKNKLRKEEMKEFARTFQQFAEETGFTISEPRFEAVANLSEYFKNMTQKEKNSLKQYNLVFTITPNRNKTCYRQLKQILHEELGIPSQNLVAKTIRNPKRRSAVIRNLVRQVICKIPAQNTRLGGALWKIRNSCIPKRSMIVGIDVWHGKAGKDESIAGIVLSFDGGLHYHAYPVHIARKGWEFIKKLGEVLSQALIENYQETHIPIENIVIFRDGVGNSQILRVWQDELHDLSTEISRNQMQIGNIPNIAVIIVNKRINRRMFLSSSKEHIENPTSGTYLEDTMIDTDYQNYYMVAHSTRSGTVRPVHYTMICNSTPFSEPKLLEMGYELSCLYYNWTGPIRVPAPIEYAHKLAEHIGITRIQEIRPNLLRTNFYL